MWVAVFSITYDFLYGEKYEHDVLPAARYEDCLDERGIYGWFLRVPRSPTELDVEQFRSVCTAKTLEITAKAPFNDRYFGPLGRSTFDEAPHLSELKYLPLVTSVFAPPIYIGISDHIRGRLRSHYAALVDELAGPGRSQDVALPNEDSDAESSTFAARLGRLLRENGVGDTRGLFIKVTYLPDASRQELLDLEYYLNRTFVPILGRR